MSTSERTFNQVRAILSKLDRSIEEARERRTQPPVPPSQAAVPAPVAHQSAPPPSAPSQAPTSQYGRAQPLPRPQAQNMLRWNK